MAGISAALGAFHGSALLARKPSESRKTGVIARTASRAASIAISKHSEGVDGATMGTGLSPLRPNIACSRSACSVFVGRPVLGPPRCTLTTIIGSSSIIARLIASLLSAMPGPLVPVTASAPPNEAPMTAQTAAISSSAWNVRTSKCRSEASVCRMSLAGVIG